MINGQSNINLSQFTPKRAWDIFLQNPISKHFYYIDTDIEKLLKTERPIPSHASPYFINITEPSLTPVISRRYAQLGDYAGGILGIIKFVIDRGHSIKNGWYISPSVQHTRIPALQKDSKGFWLYIGTENSLQNHSGDKLLLYEEIHITT